MTPMLEKVARAIAEAYVDKIGGAIEERDDVECGAILARAALLAMREPDSATVLAGDATGDQYEGCEPEECWPAMIDAILKE